MGPERSGRGCSTTTANARAPIATIDARRRESAADDSIAGIDRVRGVRRDAGSSRTSSSATFRSAIDCHRRSGSFRRQRAITFSRSRGTPG